MAALSALGAVTLAMAVSAPPLSATPPAADPSAVSRAPARTVLQAITRAERLGAIDAADATRHRVRWRRARTAAGRLPAGRREIVADAIATARAIAAAGELRAGRIAPVMAGVEASLQLARTAPSLPAPGGRATLPRDSAVYSYRPPAGFQLHPLGTIGKVNALAATCTDEARRRGWRCRRATLRAAADRLIELSVPAGRTLRFEYLFPFGGGRPGWISAMTQGTGAQALARTFRITGDERYRTAARAAYRALVAPAPRGTAVRSGGRISHLAMYSFRPSMRVLNGEEQALIGVTDYARITGHRAAGRLARRGARSLAGQLGGFDTGAWTLYSLGGGEADLNYHRLAARFARGLCTRAVARGFCPAAARFGRYTREPPRLWLTAPARVRAPRRVTVVLGASKQTTAQVTVRDGAGKVVLWRRLALGRSGARIVLPVRRVGRHTVTLDARAANGRTARSTVSLTATARPRPRRADRRRPGAAGDRPPKAHPSPEPADRDSQRPTAATPASQDAAR
ncbi:MAG: hypothetical protein QOD55_1541 [Solirubrobacteraceae bacterium]|nr:hypothetical protein [Solirubrobacteraceae bacterium]